MHPLLRMTPEVADALAARRPVVALETSIVAQGLPWPDNLATARRLVAVVREEGAVPAMVALADGRVRIGLEDELLERLASEPLVKKVSRADLAPVLASGTLGATTVAATMIAAHLAGVRLFATGGIGGVHRGAAESFDVSADLEELARTPVAVVCAGAKAILDLPKTLEYLETRGVPVIGYGTDDFPAFFCRTSGLRLAARGDTPEAIAAILLLQARLGLFGGAVVAQPVAEEAALAGAELDAALADALAAAARDGVAGRELTPFLLARIDAATAGRSRAANQALVEANARLAARIARALALQQAGLESGQPARSRPRPGIQAR